MTRYTGYHDSDWTTGNLSGEHRMTNNTWASTLNQTRIRKQFLVLPESVPAHVTASSKLEAILRRFRTIGLEEMDSVALLNRVDTKFIIPIAKLAPTLSSLQDEYHILTVKGKCCNHYRTLYFDTPDFDLFNMHVNGQADRYKVRSREYIDTHLSFLEVKHKTLKERTIKQRIPTEQPVLRVYGDTEEWLDGVYPFETRDLEPKIWNNFTRITLVNMERCERVTVDMDITFFNANRFTSLDGIAVAEVKLDALRKNSPFKLHMRNQHIQPQGFSKYCMGTSMLYDRVKKNTLKASMLWIEKVSKGAINE